jgi:hypothetical protein
MKAVRGQKHLSGAKKKHEGVYLIENVFDKSCSTTSKTPEWVQSDLSYNLCAEI